MDGVQQLDEIIPGSRSGRADPAEQLDHPTPCPKFTVAGVLEHMIGGATTSLPRSGASPQGPLHPLTAGSRISGAGPWPSS